MGRERVPRTQTRRWGDRPRDTETEQGQRDTEMGKGTDTWTRTWKAGNRGEKGGMRLIHFVSPAELPLRG